MTFANLHMHTFFSDGAVSPEKLMNEIYNLKDLEYFALTDHDSLSGIEPIFRLKKMHEAEGTSQKKVFIPGIELSLKDRDTNLSVHLIGLFPDINEGNLNEELKNLDFILGEFCRYRCLNRAIPDMDSRIRHAFSINLDGLKDNYNSADEVIAFLRNKADRKNASLLLSQDKDKDIINYPIPITYQTIIDHWEELLPSSSKEKVTLYILRPNKQKIKDLAKIYISEGMDKPEADKLAEKMQGVLARFERTPIDEISILEGLAFLKKTGAITIVAHPAVDHFRISYYEFDQTILYPMINSGLDGIEVFYPYDMNYRDEAISHYKAIAEEKDLLISGGTDFHGDGRTTLDEITLNAGYAKAIINSGKGIIE